MILGFARRAVKNGVSLVATSNIVPDGLYKDGLQRARFLPAIALLKQHTEVVNVDSGIDYRLRALEQAELYHYPLSEAVEHELEKSFRSLLLENSKVLENEALTVENRTIVARKVANDVAWFDFRAFVMALAAKMTVSNWVKSTAPLFWRMSSK